MAEFNPYKLEEEKWTPNNVYEILPPNAVSWSDYEFGQGTDNVNQEAANKSLIDGFVDFFKELFGTAGKILAGAVEVGGVILGGFVKGVAGLIGGIAKAIGSIFRGSGESPNLPLFNPIKTNLEAAIQPQRDKINESLQRTEEILAEQLVLRGQMDESLQDMRDARDRANEAIEKSGQSIAEAQAASDAAEAARQTLEEYNTALNKRITTEFNSAVGRANTAVEKADTLAGELADFKAQHQREINDAVGKAEKAVADLAALSPQVESALAESSAANQKVATLTPQVSDAVTKAGAAVSKADQTLADYTAWAKAQKTRIDSAVSKAEKASSDLAALSPRVDDAVSKASKATSDVSALTPRVTAAQTRADNAYKEAENVRSEVAPKIEAAQTKGETALAAADKAIDWLRNPNEIGASLIAIDPETGKPNWAEHLDPVTAEENPLNLPNAYKTGANYSKNPRHMSVNVDPSTEYIVSLWVKANKPGSDMTYDIKNQDGELAFGSRRRVDGFLDAGGDRRAFWIKNVPTEWTQYKKIVTPRETTRTAEFGISYFKHPSGDTRDAVQYIADFQIYPLVPSQADVDQAQNDAIKANQDILRQQDEINEAQRVANLAQKNFNDNQKKWNDGVTAALETQKKVNDNFSKWTDGAATAISANTKAIKALSKPEIGESLIEYLTPTDAEVQAGTARYDIPVWSTAAPKSLSVNHEISQKLPEGYRTEVYYASSTDGTGTARKSGVKVRPGTKYIWSFWARGSGKIVIYMYGNGNGSPVRMTRQIKVNQETYQAEYDSEGRRLYDPAANGNSSDTNGTQWLLNGFKPDKLYDWTHYKFEVEFTESTTEVWFQNFYWNWGEVSTYGQYLANMQFYPDVPTQGQVDAAQNKAIEALNLFASKQDEWNKGTKAALDAQKKVDDNFQKWTDGAAEAIEANKNAIKALNSPQMGTSVIPLMPGTQTPAWTVNADGAGTNPTNIKDGDPRWYRFDRPQLPGSYNLVAVDSSLEYDFSVWVHGTTGSKLFVELRDQDGNHAVKSGTITSYTTNDGSQYLIEKMTLQEGWRKVSTTITLNAGVKFVRINTIYGNHSSGVAGSAYLADMRMVPHVPTQASVDKAQNDAIEANTEALKALGKKVLGASLVPYKTPSTQEVKDYAAGKLNYDPWADPEYLNAGHSIASPARGRVARANADQRTKNFTGSYVTVDSNIGYKVKFHTYASTSGSNLYIYMVNQDGELALAETPFTNTSVTSGGLVHNLTLPAGIKEWSGVIKFKPGTTQVRLDTFFWNHPNGSTTGTQEFGGLEIVPNIPDANVVNELQDNSIRKNEKIGIANKQAIEALRDGLNASIELGEVNQIVGNLRDELEEEAKKREALQEKIDALQTEMIPRTIVSDDRATYDDYVSLNGNTVTAKGSWAGQLAVTYIENASGAYKTRVTRKSVPDGTTRSWKIWDSIQRVDYWVYQGRQRTIQLKNTGAYITGSSFSKGTWSVLATHKVGKTYGTGKIEWRANLLYADRNATYRFAIEVNGTTVKNVVWTNIGPLTPLGDGQRTLKFEHEFNLPDDATVRILGYISGGGSQQAKVTLLQGTLVYVQDTAREG